MIDKWKQQNNIFAGRLPAETCLRKTLHNKDNSQKELKYFPNSFRDVISLTPYERPQTSAAPIRCGNNQRSQGHINSTDQHSKKFSRRMVELRSQRIKPLKNFTRLSNSNSKNKNSNSQQQKKNQKISKELRTQLHKQVRGTTDVRRSATNFIQTENNSIAICHQEIEPQPSMNILPLQSKKTLVSIALHPNYCHISNGQINEQEEDDAIASTPQYYNFNQETKKNYGQEACSVKLSLFDKQDSRQEAEVMIKQDREQLSSQNNQLFKQKQNKMQIKGDTKLQGNKLKVVQSSQNNKKQKHRNQVVAQQPQLSSTSSRENEKELDDLNQKINNEEGSNLLLTRNLKFKRKNIVKFLSEPLATDALQMHLQNIIEKGSEDVVMFIQSGQRLEPNFQGSNKNNRINPFEDDDKPLQIVKLDSEDELEQQHIKD